MKNKKIIFLTGTRADFGKIKSLLRILIKEDNFNVYLFVTGMHLQKKYGYTIEEIKNEFNSNVYLFSNTTSESTMDLTLSKTIKGFSQYVNKIKPNMIVVHGDRPEALAGAIVGSFNNILVSHIEGGELSGTIDESIRHSVSKLSHLHFVSNQDSRKRLMKMGESEDKVFVIGSPDIDLMNSKKLPSIQKVKTHYGFDFQKFSILLFHPVTTEINYVENQINSILNSLVKSKVNGIVIYPNNDPGSRKIISIYKSRLKTNKKFKVFPSIRFEYFLTLLKHANFLIGNSSAGVRETPYYGIPSINIGSRQNSRNPNADSIINCDFSENNIFKSIIEIKKLKPKPQVKYGKGNSDLMFLDILKRNQTWEVNIQKIFNDTY